MHSQRNRDALFKGIYRTYHPRVRSSLRSRLGNLHAADDMTQEIFEQLYPRIERINDVRAWIFTTMRNKLSDHFRDAMKKPAHISINDELFDDPDEVSACRVSEERIILEEVLDGIDDEDSRLLFDLITVEGLSYEDAAERMGISMQRARYQYGIVLRKVRHDLAARGIRGVEDLIHY